MYAGIYHYQVNTEDYLRKPARSLKSQTSVSQPANRPAGEAQELAYAKDHLSRIKRFPITSRDTVLVALPTSETNWLEVVDACLLAGAEPIIVDTNIDAVQAAKTTVEHHATIIATTAEMWTEIYRELNANPGDLNQIQAIVFDRDNETETRNNLLLSALSKAKIDDVYAAYQKAPALQNKNHNNY